MRHAGDHWQGKHLGWPPGPRKPSLVRTGVASTDLPPDRRPAPCVAPPPLHGPQFMDTGGAPFRAPPRDTPMANKMLIDATHPEETRVVVLRGNRVEEFDFESASRRQLRGNIYL